MDQHEKDIMKKIEEKAQEIPVPESLEPEAVMKKIEEQKVKTSEKSRKKKTWIYRIGGLAAACLVAVAGLGIYWNQQKTEGMAESSGTSGQSASKNAGSSADTELVISDEKQIASAASYEDAYDYLDAYLKYQQSLYDNTSDASEGIAFYSEDAVTEEIADSASSGARSSAAVSDETGVMAIASEDSSSAESASEDSANTGSASTDSVSDYSETNVRQEGVDEADIVKTDGKYLYVKQDNAKEIAIVDTDDGTLKEVQSIEVEDVDVIREFYLDTERQELVAVCEIYQNEDAELDMAWYWGKQDTVAVTYDISDKNAPKEIGRVTQNGSYQSSRMVNGYLYLFSDYDVYLDLMEKDSPETYIPLVNGTVLAAEDVYLPSVSQAYNYSVVTSINMENPDVTYDSKAILKDGGELYVSNENIYYYNAIWDYESGTKTTLCRIGYQDGKLTAGAQSTVDGYINDSYSIDEYQGYLRIVLTDDGENENCVRILDQSLEEVGSIEGLAEDERVYSARFMGDVGYFVTYRETDPLFSVDLSDPENPEIIGSLKIPGFSEYLHPYGDGKLLGIGMAVDEESNTTDGVKISMFDISDPSNVKEEDTYILKNVYSTDVFYDYKSALVNADKNLIGFAGYTEGMECYYLFTYDEDNGFTCNMEEEINGSSMMNARGVYIEDILYVIQGNVIESYSLKDYQKVDDIIL